MAHDMSAADALTHHVFGPADPSPSLVETGRFPPGWVEEYRRLLAVVAEEWAQAPDWPRHLVGALHYALTHLRVRYLAWQGLGGGCPEECTERALSQVEAPTRILFARAFPSQQPTHAGRDTVSPPDNSGLAALGRAGAFTVEVFSRPDGSWSLSVESPGWCFEFPLAGRAVVGELAAFLRSYAGTPRFAEILVGTLGGADVRVVKDDEFVDRFFIRAAHTGSLVEFTLAGQSAVEFVEAVAGAAAEFGAEDKPR
jgi:hypothetical protein